MFCQHLESSSCTCQSQCHRCRIRRPLSRESVGRHLSLQCADIRRLRHQEILCSQSLDRRSLSLKAGTFTRSPGRSTTREMLMIREAQSKRASIHVLHGVQVVSLVLVVTSVLLRCILLVTYTCQCADGSDTTWCAEKAPFVGSLRILLWSLISPEVLLFQWAPTKVMHLILARVRLHTHPLFVGASPHTEKESNRLEQIKSTIRQKNLAIAQFGLNLPLQPQTQKTDLDFSHHRRSVKNHFRHDTRQLRSIRSRNQTLCSGATSSSTLQRPTSVSPLPTSALAGGSCMTNGARLSIVNDAGNPSQ